MQPAEQAPTLVPSRYRIERRLGSGAMGEVWSAHDPELSREVAIKVVPPGRADGADTERLLREARSLAKLSHPNVVAVFDVGAADAGPGSTPAVYIVMELVEGTTLAEWLASRERSWREIVDAFLQAAAGLAAVHRAGLVHRDFKPTNVFVGSDGRVRVGDFGLPRVANPRDDAPEREASVVAGDDEPPTPAADQFAFCTALFEALFRERPFPGRATELMKAKLDGHIVLPPVLPCPRNVVDVVLRGLRPLRSDRWPTMADLERALRKAAAPNRGAVRWLVGGVAALAVVGAGYLPAARDTCPVSPVGWTLPLRIAVAQTLTSDLETPQVEAVLARIDARAKALDATAAQACSNADIDRGCVRLASTQLVATVTLLANGDRTLARHAEAVVELLPNPLLCSTDGTRPTPADQLATWDAIARVRVLVEAGHGAEALKAADAAMREVDALGDAGARARALLAYARAQTLYDMGDPAGAEAAYEVAYLQAVEVDDALTAARAAADLMAYHGRKGSPDAAVWRRHTETWTPRVRASPPQRARLEIDLAIGLAHIGEHDAAIEHFGQALDLCDGETCPALHIVARDGIAEVMIAGGRAAEAVALRRAILEEIETEVGTHSRAAARARISLAEASSSSAPRESLLLVEAAIPLLSNDGAPGTSLSQAHLIAAQSHVALGEGPEALVSAQRALQVFEPRARVGDTSVVAYRATLATALEATGDLQGARRELDTLVESEPADPTVFAQVLVSRSHNRTLTEDFEGAIADARLAREVLGVLVTTRHDLVLASLTNEAWAQLARAAK